MAGTGITLIKNANGTKTINATSVGGVTSVSNSDGTLTISPTTGAVVGSLNLANANTWTGQQTISGSDFTLANSNLKVTYTAAPATPTLALVATSTGNVTAGQHKVQVTIVGVSGETEASALSSAVTADSTHKQLTVGNLPLGVNLNIYLSKSGYNSTLRLGTGTTITNNASTTYTINVADGSLSSIPAPTVNSTSGNIYLAGTKYGQFINPGYLQFNGFTTDTTFGLNGTENFGYGNTVTGISNTFFGSAISSAGGSEKVGIGHALDLGGANNSIAIGAFSSAVATNSLVIGSLSTVSGANSISIGGGSGGNSGQYTTLIGTGISSVSGSYITAIGANIYAPSAASTIVGYNAQDAGGYGAGTRPAPSAPSGAS